MSGKREVIAGGPSVRGNPDHRPEGVRQSVRQLAAPGGRREARQEPAGDGAGVEATGLGIAKGVLGERRRRRLADQWIRMRERGVEPAQRPKSRARPLLGRRGIDAAQHFGLAERAGNGRALDFARDLAHRRLGHPFLPAGAELRVRKPVEEGAEEVGVVHYLTNT